MLSFSSICRRNSIFRSLCTPRSHQRQTNNCNFHYERHCPISSRSVHHLPDSDIIENGCEKLPDLTLIWPFHMWPSDIVANSLNEIQHMSGLPWWCSILVGGVLLKVPLFGFNIYNFRRMQQAFVTSPRQLTHFVLTYFNNLITKGEVQALKMANHERRYTIFREGMNWDKSLKIQMFSHISYAPIYWLVFAHLSMFTGLHWLNRINYIPLTSGGLPWCLDLTSADPYMILPVICVITGSFNLYLHPMHWIFPLPEVKMQNCASLTILPLIGIAMSILSSLPADFILYMISTNLAACVLNFSIRHPAIHNELGLLSSSESLNRFIPPSKTFIELNKTLDRQQLLLEQKEAQNALSPGNEVLQIGEKHQELLDDPQSLTTDKSTKSILKAVNNNELLDEKMPHLNVKKVF